MIVLLYQTPLEQMGERALLLARKKQIAMFELPKERATWQGTASSPQSAKPQNLSPATARERISPATQIISEADSSPVESSVMTPDSSLVS